MTRLTLPQRMMEHARTASLGATCSRLSVGAALTRDGHLLSTGYNGAPRGIKHCYHAPGDTERCTISVHAELNAIYQAGYHGVRTSESVLYVTHAPCLGCSGGLINAGVSAVFYEELYGSEDGIQALRHAGKRVERLGEPESSEFRISRPWEWWNR